MTRVNIMMAAALAVANAGCRGGERAAEETPTNAAAPATAAALSLTRLDCGDFTVKNFDKFFSDRPGLYEAAPRETVGSCYLIRHGDDLLLWDTGFAAALKGKTEDMGDIVVRLKRTLAEQLAEIGVRPQDVDLVGISHWHPDHTGQAAEFANAELVIGRGDFAASAGKDDPFASWRGEGKAVRLITGDTDLFGDGKVVALHLPGHTPDHLALRVNLAGGPVLLSGDLYHSRDAREKRGMPGFNTSREQTLASMNRFEALARQTRAKVVIQHEPRDIALLPAFPQAAQ